MFNQRIITFRKYVLFHSFLFVFFFFCQSFVYSYSTQSTEQPIDFSHKTHVLENQVPCEYCHSDARKSKFSGIPPVRTCIGCHSVIDGKGGRTEEEISNLNQEEQDLIQHKINEIKKVRKYWDDKQPIPWNRMHDLPDFAYFSHKRHLSIGFDCTECHGDVSQVKVPVPQEKFGEIPLSMGWCMTCHRKDHPTIDGKIASPIRETRGGKILKEAPMPNGSMKGYTDCLACHK